MKVTEKDMKIDSLSTFDMPAPTCGSVRPKKILESLWRNVKRNFKMTAVVDDKDRPADDVGLAGWENNTYAFIKAHLNHGIVDVAASLLGFAVAINSL